MGCGSTHYVPNLSRVKYIGWLSEAEVRKTHFLTILNLVQPTPRKHTLFPAHPLSHVRTLNYPGQQPDSISRR